MPMISVKQQLYIRGIEIVTDFCHLNSLPIPNIQIEEPWLFDACAYYRPQYIRISLKKCASPGTELQWRNWNWPGSTTDREPMGVLCHELGHHIDILFSSRDNRGAYFGDFSVSCRLSSGEKEITSYCPNDGEWFAEMFRLFVTNPDLLRLLHPNIYGILERRFDPVITENWIQALGSNVPSRILLNLMNKQGKL